MVFVPGGDPSRSDLPDDVETGLAHVCQTTLYNPHGVLDGVDVMANAFGQEIPRIASGVYTDTCGDNGIFEDGTDSCDSHRDREGDARSSDDELIADRERNTGMDWTGMECILFLRMWMIHARGWCLRTNCFRMRNGPIRPCWFVRGDVLVLTITEDIIVRDEQTDGVLGLSLPMCNLRIQRDASDVRLSHGDMTWLCLLSSADAGTVEDRAMSMGLGGQSLDRWRGGIWDPGIIGQQDICVCYDCICLMALFRTIIVLMQDWAVWPVWTVIGSGYCRTIAWELGWLHRLIMPCDVDLVCAKMTRQIKGDMGDVIVEMTDGNDNNRLQRCAGVRGTSLGVLSAGGIPIRVIGRFGCERGSVGCSDWLPVCGAIIFSPKRVRINYIHVRRAMCGRSSTNAAPVTGSLVFFAPLDCLSEYCASCLLFCGTD